MTNEGNAASKQVGGIVVFHSYKYKKQEFLPMTAKILLFFKAEFW